MSTALSMRALFPRFLEAERKYGSVLRAFRQIRQPKSSQGAFMSLPGGLEEIIGALMQALPPDTVALGCAASAVTADPARSVYTVTLESGERVSARAVVMCAPAFVASQLLEPIDAELSRLCGRVPYASSATVTLAYRREDVTHPLRGSGFVVPRVERTTIMAGSWISSKWRMRAPEGRVLLRSFIGGARDPQALERSDDDLIEASRQELGRLLGIRGEPLFTRLHRWERANAQHDVGHLDLVASIDRRLDRLPGLYVTGSGFRGVGVPDCVADGRATGERVAGWLSSSSRASASSASSTR